MNRAVLLIGGNIENRKQYLIDCCSLIKKEIGEISISSSIYETEAWGVTDQSNFLNQAIIVNTSLTPNDLLQRCLNISPSKKNKQTNKKKTRQVNVLFYSIIKCY